MSARDAADQLLTIMDPIGQWLSDPATEDVCINRPGEVWVRQRGRFMRHETARKAIEGPIWVESGHRIGHWS